MARRHRPEYRCPSCGEAAGPVGVTCPRCDLPMRDQDGRLPPPFPEGDVWRRRVRSLNRAPARGEVPPAAASGVLGFALGLGAGVTALVIGQVALAVAAPLVGAAALAGATHYRPRIEERWRNWRDARRGRREASREVSTIAEALAGVPPDSAPAGSAEADGVPPDRRWRLRGHLHVLSPAPGTDQPAAAAPGAAPVAARRLGEHLSLGQFLIIDPTGRAVVDDSSVVVIGLADGEELVEGDGITVVARIRAAERGEIDGGASYRGQPVDGVLLPGNREPIEIYVARQR